MSSKWIGAALVFLSCGVCGFSIANSYRSEERMYKNLISIITIMKAELQFQLTSLPELCNYVSNQTEGRMRRIFARLSEELKTWTCPDSANCIRKILNEEKGLSQPVRKLLQELGNVLGRFDLNGQIQGLEMIKSECEYALKLLNVNRNERIQGYQTLGLCAGAALIILFI